MGFGPDAHPGDGAQAPAVLRGLLAAVPAAVTYLAGPELVIEFANGACRELAGRDDLAGRPIADVIPEVAGQGRLEILRRVVRTGEPAVLSGAEVRLAGDGHMRQAFLDYRCQPVLEESGAVAGVVLYLADVTASVRDHRRLEELTTRLAAVEEASRAHPGPDRAELLASEREARAEAGTARERLTFLLQAGGLAGATGDRQQLLRQVADLVVPTLADSCAVYLATGDGMLRAAAVAHRDPARNAALGRLLGRRIPAAGALLSQDCFSRGVTRLVTDVSGDLSRWAQAGYGMADTIAQVQPASAVAVPLTAGGQRLGVITMSRGSNRPRFAAADLDVIGELARTLATALAAATTIAAEHTVAETLQRSLLPTLPVIAELDLAIRYLPASGTDVGGDWYDLFRVGATQVSLVIGDVAGHSIGSASVMGQLRSIIRAYAIHDPHPRTALSRTGRAVAQLLPSVMATAICGVLDVASGELRYANAGHPPPLLLTREGRAEFLTAASGIALGATDDPQLLPGHQRLPPGATLLLYTDGLIENRTRDLDDGMAKLAGALRGHPGRDAEEVCAAAQNAMLGDGSLSDDVCLLAVRRPG